ncbi:MAG TPA: 2-dehydropantoate 2-reductase [Spirochaetota bacterium]|nr:2-dehydropantoate 2-reductase [Spirochaetota bacterium]HOM09333.1 2-dehydropantoate 2-reductase [Spirochaetota bacterium]HPP49920.1 2-dehydropantoate 2-reductase [Spirochaetota bacterium]
MNELNLKDKKIVIFGTGAIGATLAAWLYPFHDNLYCFDKKEITDVIDINGITVYHIDSPDKRENYKIKTMHKIEEISDADIIIFCVKNYSLEGCAKAVKDVLKNSATIISMANGIDNQYILPKYFDKIIYGVISYNAWIDTPGVAGYQKKGPFILGTPDNSLMDEMQVIADYFSNGVETIVTKHLQDAVHSKIVINLTNALTTLIGHGYREISDIDTFQRLLSNTLYEGVKIVKKAGYNECKLGGMPPWILIKLSAKLPRLITRPLFLKNVKKMVKSSMSQDIIQRGMHMSELDSLTGYIVKLAKQNGIKAPYNGTIYNLCQERFNQSKFEPMDVKEVWERVKENL